VGASNAMSALRLYSSRVPPLSMCALAYMALVSIDKDAEPWYQAGAELLAVMALGRDPLAETGDAKADARARKAMEVACERALRPLFATGAITTAKRSSGHLRGSHHAKYRLWLDAPAPDEARDPRNRAARGAPYGNRGVQNPGETEAGNPADDGVPYGNRRAPEDGTLRKPCPHPTESVTAPYGIRRAKEYEEEEERIENLEEHPPLSSDPVPVRAREASDDRNHVTSVRVIESPLLAVVQTEETGEDARCRYDRCLTPPQPIEGDGHHARCRLLASVKAKGKQSPAASRAGQRQDHRAGAGSTGPGLTEPSQETA